ncbi:hypothetical protein QUB75_01215 [Microcoleus sp. K1-B6]|uniref:hypothetical protein n=1 Tax=Microcoleus sp. K1-B6 TaxID=2818787 RepID=UPI002FD861DA
MLSRFYYLWRSPFSPNNQKGDRPFLPKVRSAYNFSMATTVKFNRAIGIIKKSTSNTVN